MHVLVENNRQDIARLCRLHGVRKMELFGSILRDDFDLQHSDVDVVVDFEPQFAASFTNSSDDRWTWLNCRRSEIGGCVTTLSEASCRFMPQRDPGVYLEDIEHYVSAAIRFMSGFGLEQ
jgi:Nucleotidyltransferase domain